MNPSGQDADIKMNSSKGYTLVEVTVATGVSMILLLAVYGVVNFAQRSTSGIERKVAAQQDVKPALDLMTTEIGMASYNPHYNANIWRAAGDCSGNGILAYRGIQEATAHSITVQMDINGNNSVADDNEIIRYNYDHDGQDRYMTRSTSCGNGQPFLGESSANKVPRSVRVINEEMGLPVFRYYNGSDGRIDPEANPSVITDIRRIQITLAVETDQIDPNTGQRRRLIYTTSVIPRNHANIR